MIAFPHVCIVPAKAGSLRVPGKNFRPFAGEHSLVDITIERLLAAGVNPYCLYLSCEDPAQQAVADEWGVRFHLRDPKLCANDAPFDEWIRSTAEYAWRQLPYAQSGRGFDLIWAQVCNPFFDEHAACFEKWSRFRHTQSDSLVVRHPRKRYLMGPDGRPIGWGWGPWHTKSQLLPTTYEFTWCLSVLKWESVQRVGYHVGADPLWWDATGPVIDIDTPEDFELARQLYALRHP